MCESSHCSVSSPILGIFCYFFAVVLVGVFCSNFTMVLVCISLRIMSGSPSHMPSAHSDLLLCEFPVLACCPVLLGCLAFSYCSVSAIRTPLLGSFGEQLRKDFWLTVGCVVNLEEWSGKRGLTSLAMDCGSSPMVLGRHHWRPDHVSLHASLTLRLGHLGPWVIFRSWHEGPDRFPLYWVYSVSWEI